MEADPPTRGHRVLSPLLVLALALLGLGALVLLSEPPLDDHRAVAGLVSVGLLGAWRWGWFGLHLLRSRVYNHGTFPIYRMAADRMPLEKLPQVALLVPSYKEKPWITERVMRAIASEARSLPRPVIVLVSSASDEENDFALGVLEEADPGLAHVRFIPMTQSQGKRKAMADALRRLAAEGLDEDAVIALMDGDTELHSGALRRTLSFFALMDDLGALTTDEVPVVWGSALFSEWFHLRFAQRHIQMASLSLGGRVLCLTGRYSLFRARCALDPSFARILAEDQLDHWLWGRFPFLSGDDKSTWYWLLQRGHRMLYVPDVTVGSLETVSGSVGQRAVSNMRRWYGNMLRTNARAIALGPRRVPLYAWWCLIDQRVSMWTSLITPGILLIFALSGDLHMAATVAAWVLFSRSLMLQVVFWGRPSVLRPLHLPMLIGTQWIGSLIKIWTQMNLAQQRWANRGGQEVDAAGAGAIRLLQRGTSSYLLFTQAVIVAVVLLSMTRVLSPIQDARAWTWQQQYAINPAPVAPPAPVEEGARHTWRTDFSDPGWLDQNKHRYKYLGLNLAELRRDEAGRGYLRVHYPEGSVNSTLAKQGLAPMGGAERLFEIDEAVDAATLRYQVRFSPGFDFVKGGKLPGLYGGDAISGSNTPDGTNGLSTRLMWREDGEGEVYAYLPTSHGYGTSLGRGSWTFTPGVWHTIEQTVVLNTPGRANGYILLDVDGQRVVEARGLVFRTTDALKIEGLFFSTFFGGSDLSWAADKDCWADFLDLEISWSADRVARAE
jgi:glycosyltransferase Alg8